MRGDENATSVPQLALERLQEVFLEHQFGQMAIVAAGPAANFLFGILLFVGVYMGFGKAFIPPVIGEITEGSPAQEAGLKIDDRVLFVWHKIKDFSDLRTIVFENPDRQLVFEIERQDVLKSLTSRHIRLF